MSESMLLSLNWHFYDADKPACILQDLNGEYEAVTIPHDSVIGKGPEKDCPYGPSQGFRRRWGVTYYTKDVELPALSHDEELFLEFDGVYENCTVYVNGEEAGSHAYGYTGFSLGITDWAKPGTNRIAVRVDNSAMPPDRWYSGAGIYRPVRLLRAHRSHIVPDSVFVRTGEIKENGAQVLISFETTGGDFVKVSVGKLAKTVPCGRKDNTLSLFVESPFLWSSQNPYLYELELQVIEDGETVDRFAIPFGIRKVQFSAEEGLKVNGLPVKLKGVNLHHDCGCLGAAGVKSAWRRRLLTFRKMGCNAIRCSHNPPARELLELCDEMGFYVLDEALDKWVSGSYERYYASHALADVEAMVKRDRSHPSVLIWSVGNEVEAQGSDEMIARMADLAEAVRTLDDTRPVTYAMVSVFLNDRTQTSREKSLVVHKMAEHLDIISCNYQEQWYETYHEDTPDKPILGTEIFPFYCGRGETLKAYYDRNPWLTAEELPYVLGGFVWAGADYLGESAAWPSKGWTASLLDLLGNRRPVSYLFESFWSNEPMAYMAFVDGTMRGDLQKDHWGFPRLASHWNFAHYGQEALPFQVYTNCEAAAVYLNGEHIITLEKKDYANRIITGYLPNQPGTVEVRGLRGGEEICTYTLKTAGKPHHIEASFDAESLAADGVDVVYADVRIVDEAGVLCPQAENEVRFAVEGAGSLFAVDNGDLLGSHGYHDSKVNAFRGKCACVVRSAHEEGEIRLSVTADGLETAYLTIQSKG